ncbi:MAG: PBP1A family penicillin-binding protein [Thermodesulfobacteriota bacterium]
MAKSAPKTKPKSAPRRAAPAKPKARPRRRWPFWLLALALLAGAGLGLYAWRLAVQVEDRFAGRRWSLPSRVYADSALLYPGQNQDLGAVAARLRDLGYRRVEGPPRLPGEWRQTGSGLEVHLRELVTPNRRREALPLSLAFASGRLAAIVRADTRQELPLLELEPQEVMQYFGPERETRSLVALKDVSPHLVHAVLAAEDADFYEHSGVSPLGVLRALWVNLSHGAVRQGGSTITQQLAKNFFLTPERTIARKAKELLIALILESKYDKDTILEIYLNEVYLGQKGSVALGGVAEASEFYFGRSPAELRPEQAALIAGLIRGPNAYNPHRRAEAAKARRDLVLMAMVRHGWLDEAEAALARRRGLELMPYRPYGRRAPYFMDYVSGQLGELYPPEALTSLGLGVYTTLDAQVQAAAEAALTQGLERLEKAHPRLWRKDDQERLQGAVLVMEPRTGHILAMVGGRDYGASQFNRAAQARRQPGSTFKPFVYLAGLEQFNPASLLSNQARTYRLGGQSWSPSNYDGESGGSFRMRAALARSLNLPTVDLAMRLGLDRVAATAQALGLKVPADPPPAMALGALEATPLELGRAYCALAAEGVLPYPLSLKAVTTEGGSVAVRRPVKNENAAEPARAWLVTSMLESVVKEGTARTLKPGFPLAAKTGTSNDFKDAWFVGYTPEFMALVWVGFDDGDSTGLSGAAAAMPIWADLVRRAPWLGSGLDFAPPPGVVTQTVCAESGQVATGLCPHPMAEYFEEGRSPAEYCPLHRPAGLVDRFLKDMRDAFGR